MLTLVCSMIVSTLLAGPLSASGKSVYDYLRFDKTVHDWGDVTLKDGPLSCEFSFTNVSDVPVHILSVRSSCGCTGVKWPVEEIAPGQSGVIYATYSNDEGPYPFDKTLTVSLEEARRPVVLHLRGIVHRKKLPLSQTYPIHFSAAGFRDSIFRMGNMSQGETRSSELKVANIGNSDITIEFANVSAQLSFIPSQIRIKAGSVANIGVSLRADRSLWGSNFYYAVPVVNSVEQDGRLVFKAATKENFDSWSEQRIEDAAVARFESSVSPDPVERGTRVRVSFPIANDGKTTLRIYKTDFSGDEIVYSEIPATVPAGKSAAVNFTVNTSSMKEGSENLCIATLYTNDPAHPVIHLYIDVIIL